MIKTKRYIILCFVIVFTLTGCGNTEKINGRTDMSDIEQISTESTAPAGIEIKDYLTYNNNVYTYPIWKGNFIVNESFMIVQNEDGSFPEIPLLYKPTKIIAVRSATLEISYEENKDYTISGNKIIPTENTSFPFIPYDEYYPAKPVEPGWYKDGNGKDIYYGTFDKVGGGNILFGELDFFHSRQIVVSYEHVDTWDGPVPSYEGELLPKTLKKLNNGEHIEIVLTGDSIAAGGNSSSESGASPYIPTWFNMFTEKLETIDPDIDSVNVAVGGVDSTWAIENAKEKININKPNLVVIAFGMNDICDVDGFKSNIQKIMEIIRKDCPDCEFILVSTMLPNEEAVGFLRDQPSYEQAILELEVPGVAIAQITSMHEYLLKTKRYYDMTGNNVNHLNDFLARVYSQVLLSALIEW